MHRRRLAYGSDWVYPLEMANLQGQASGLSTASYARLTGGSACPTNLVFRLCPRVIPGLPYDSMMLEGWRNPPYPPLPFVSFRAVPSARAISPL